jgi:hypothetical protein
MVLVISSFITDLHLEGGRIVINCCPSVCRKEPRERVYVARLASMKAGTSRSSVYEASYGELAIDN